MTNNDDLTIKDPLEMSDAQTVRFKKWSMNTQRYLAIDYGTVRVGLALGIAGFAEPLKVVPNNGQLFSELLHVINQELPDVVVVGLSEQDMAQQSKTFAEAFQKYLKNELKNLPEFVFADETLSSHEVQRKLHEAGHRDLRSGSIDHFAAAEFLQEYLDLHQSDETQ